MAKNLPTGTELGNYNGSDCRGSACKHLATGYQTIINFWGNSGPFENSIDTSDYIISHCRFLLLTTDHDMSPYLQVCSIIVFGSISSQGWQYHQDKAKEICIINMSSTACNLGTWVGVLAFLVALGKT